MDQRPDTFGFHLYIGEVAHHADLVDLIVQLERILDFLGEYILTTFSDYQRFLRPVR